MNVLHALAKIGGHTRIFDIAKRADVSTRTAHDELGHLIEQGLVAESTWYHLTEAGIDRLRKAGVICKRCSSFLVGGSGGLCASCVEHRRQRERFAARRRAEQKPRSALAPWSKGNTKSLAEQDAALAEIRRLDREGVR